MSAPPVAIRRAVFEALESRRMLAFGLTATSGSYTVDTGAQTVFTISRANGDLTSMKFNGTELEAPYALASRYSHYESGLSGSTAVTATTDPAGNWIKIACDDSAGVGVIHYYIARKGYNNIYMATYAAALPSPGEMRFIAYTDHSVLVNAPNPSDISSNTGAIEGSDVFVNADGTTHSKFYGAARMIDDVYHGLTGANVGLFMNMGNRETGSGGPFFKDIEFQTTGPSVSELYNYMYSGHTQPDAYRPGLQGPYALQFTNGAAPATPDYSFIDGLNLTGAVLPAARGTLTGTASGVPSGHEMTVGLSNGAAQYWTHPDSVTGRYTIAAAKPGTYTETLYQDELEVGTRSVTIAAGASTSANITDTYQLPPAIWRIGTWDGTPAGFLNADKIATMHPTDVRMSAWPNTVFTVGASTDANWPLAEFRAVNGDNQIAFNLTSAQAATPMTLRIGISFAFAGGRPIISVNGGTYSSAPAASNQPNSRGITRGTWRGNNWLYTYNISTSSVHSGLNTIDIGVASGSSGSGFLSPSFTFDALDLVATSSLTNAPHIASIALTPAAASLNAFQHQVFSAIARDQFNNVIAANLTWSATRGGMDGLGNYIAPRIGGSDTVTASVGSMNGAAAISVLTTAPNAAPTVATPAAAASSLISGTSATMLSVLGADDDGESNLKYTWSVAGTAPGPVIFSVNGNNAAKSTVATFATAGTYVFQVTITDAYGLSTMSLTTVKVQSDQVVRYPADMTSGSILTDTSGNNNSAALTGSYDFTAGVGGNALHLTGGSALLPANIIGGLNDFTIATWVKLDSLANWARVFDFGTGTNNYMFLTLDAGGTNKPRFAITNGGGAGEQQLNAPNAVAAGVWTHLAVTLAGNTATLYVNGQAVATNTSAGVHPAALGLTTGNYLGKSQFADPALAGSIDDFQIYSRALSGAEVLQLAAPAGPLILQAVPGTNSTYLRKDADGVNLDIWSNSATPGSGAPSRQVVLSSIPSVSVTGSSLADQLTLDFSNGDPLPLGGVSFDGGAGVNTLAVIGTSAADTLTAGPSGLTFAGGTFSFSGGTLSTVPITLANVDHLQFHGGSGGSDSVIINGGTYTLDADTPVGTTPSMAVTVGAGSTGIFNSDQRLASLTANGGVVDVITATRKTINAAALSIVNGGTVDIGNNVFLTNTPVATIQAYVAAAYNASTYGAEDGKWDGHGLTSSLAKNSYSVGTGVSKYSVAYAAGSDASTQDDIANGSVLPVVDGQVLIEPALTGDVNLDGVVDVNDISSIMGYHYEDGHGAHYTDGDVANHGIVNTDDISFVLSANFQG